MQDPGSWVLSLSNSLCADTRRTGGKAAELSRLLQEGLPVPAAYVVTAEAFHAHIPDANPGDPPIRPELNEALSATLAEVSAELCNTPEDYLAVRSSALGEDGVEHSFAGQHATYYYVAAGDINKAVVDCWLSLWSDAATAYRAATGTDSADFGMAVVVQKMIQADRSGVCFTTDPTGFRHGEAAYESSSYQSFRNGPPSSR
jgi:phosphoenolpyruvate synthase/pyruvate phosphate dikinase